MKIAGYETHPAADLFPMMEAEELRALADDIKAHGLHNPVTLYTLDGKRQILDGRNRARACEMVGVSPAFEAWTGEGSPVEWVVSQNIHRRHLTTSQRSMVAAGLVPMFEAEAHARSGARTDLSAKRRGGPEAPPAAFGKATEKAAAVMSVSPRSVERAVKVAREAPEVVEAVRSGKATVHAAARALPPKSKPKGESPKAAHPPRPVDARFSTPGRVASSVFDAFAAVKELFECWPAGVSLRPLIDVTRQRLDTFERAERENEKRRRANDAA